MQTLKSWFSIIFIIGLIPTLYAETNAKVDPEVIDRIEEMGKYLRSLKKFEVESNFTFEIATEDNQKFSYPGKLHYKVKRPNKLFAELKSDHKQRQYYYDGTSMTIYDPKSKFYGQIAAPETIDELMEEIEENYKIILPLEDLFDWGTDKAPTDKISMATYIGESKINNIEVEQFVIRQGNIDWQLWVKKGDEPIPQKIIYTAIDDQVRPQFSAELKWTLDPKIKTNDFEFKPPKGSYKIEINPPEGDAVAKQKVSP
ncbi:DUF2092 domain-containing protein [Peredibacter starrii]|uniref:DUF2092 domain-containing protein n=1 Tax=Peredibacter starrii TaxID=28202 RepID=A0AAX4HJV8_9BACT|nr:DUF2092 domain-containing protein [Peredibacter starrii]WPU63506.1 DUF2092 domain-containing protein [Peredibacter starrii]